MPLSFGVFPGPRQDPYGNPYKTYNDSTFVTASITFEASRTYLETFLPTSDFSIVTPGNIARATFYATRLGKLEWLGGRGYNIFGLYVHNVQVKRAEKAGSADTLIGRFLPVLFENLADPIVSGREELGFSKIFADIDIEATDSTFKMTAGWGDITFAEFSLAGLTVDDDPQKPVFAMGHMRKSLSSVTEAGVLHYKYVPATGRQGQADAAYSTFTPNPTPENRGIRSVVEQRFVTSPEHVRMRFAQRTPQELPTLFNVVEGLRHLEILKIVGAQVATGTGVGDVVQQMRL